jgi:hypothetical protein
VKDLAALGKDYEGAGMDLFEEEGKGQNSSVGMVIFNCYINSAKNYGVLKFHYFNILLEVIYFLFKCYDHSKT